MIHPGLQNNISSLALPRMTSNDPNISSTIEEELSYSLTTVDTGVSLARVMVAMVSPQGLCVHVKIGADKRD